MDGAALGLWPAAGFRKVLQCHQFPLLNRLGFFLIFYMYCLTTLSVAEVI